MYKAINARDGASIVILDPQWAGAIDYLRALDAQDVLVCQRCRQPMRVRAGVVRRWHFAHKHLLNCPYGYESPALLEARAVLYEWLVGKLGDQVSIEKILDDLDFSHPIDCWVETPSGSIAYWIIDAAIKPDARDSLLQGFGQLKVTVNWVFTASMLREDEAAPGNVHLTTTEREFMHRTVYDQAVHGDWGKSLHYLDADARALITYRGLQLIHPPQLFRGRKESHELAAVQLLPKTGELVHPGEQERLDQFLQEQPELEKRRQEQVASAQRLRQRWLSGTGQAETAIPGRAARREDMDRVQESAVYQVEAICEFCGEKTSDWWYLDPKTHLCKCRACYHLGKY